jgi:glyoxylate/hydroxypyruvate reductase
MHGTAIPRDARRPRLLVDAREDSARWQAALAAALADVDVIVQSPATGAGPVDFFAGWNPPADFFRLLPSLRAVFALGAGVDAFLRRTDLSPHIPLVKLGDAGMAAQMLEYVLLGVLAWQRHLPAYASQQQRAAWRPLPPRSRGETRVGVLGLGSIGAQVAIGLARFGYCVRGWSRSEREINGVECVSGAAALDALLVRSDVLVNLLPSTQATRGLLDRSRLGRLPRGAFVVNASRGDQLDADGLLALLDDEHLSSALLDVFATEPLPPDSPLWRHPKVRITPHVAAVTLIEPAVAQIRDNLQRLRQGKAMHNVVDRERGY